MPRKGIKRTGGRSPPLILSKKRKAEDDLEEEASCSSSSSTLTSNGVTRWMTDSPPVNPSPLPKFRWGDNTKVWENMITRDNAHPRDHRLFSYHPELTRRMRVVLLDWLSEVCEVYTLHRDTFYLAQDCIDRYLAATSDLEKRTLQLMGVTCLFIAAKTEEIYPPKISEFAYVTDGACTEEEILQQEIIILMYLDWNVSTITICSWLSTYMQVEASRCSEEYDESENRNDSFEIPQFQGLAFAQLCQLLDLCVFDVDCLRFPYRHLAACAIMHLVSIEKGTSISGCDFQEVQECFRWMKPFCEVIYENMKTEHKLLDIPYSDVHNIQTHDVGLRHWEQVEFNRSVQQRIAVYQQEIGTAVVLTPPPAVKKVNLRGDDGSSSE